MIKIQGCLLWTHPLLCRDCEGPQHHYRLPYDVADRYGSKIAAVFRAVTIVAEHKHLAIRDHHAYLLMCAASYMLSVRLGNPGAIHEDRTIADLDPIATKCHYPF